MRALAPALEKIYEGDKEGLKNAMKRHLIFCNSHAFGNAFIIGISTAMEESTEEDEKESITALKTGLMGPLAALGDSMVKFVFVPIFGSIGAALAFNGNILGPILMFILYNIINWGGRIYGVKIGYYKGLDFIAKNNESNILARITSMANVVGLMVIGSLIATTVRVSSPLEIVAGENTIVFQDMIDSVMPNLLGFLVTFFVYKLLRKTEGKHTAAIIICMLVATVIATYFGIL
jgi:PTS system mannose-specific IID component